MFWAMLHHKINTFGFTFDAAMMDIEQLNNSATEAAYDIIKISYARYPQISDKYRLLTSGNALGFGNGPLLISKRKVYPDEVPHLRIAVPGIRTTANMLFSIAYPSATDKKVYLFSDIEEAVLSDEADAGLLIHETRFTYQQKGLRKIMDMGEYWENETSLPLPLGAIAVRRDLSADAQTKVNAVLTESVRFALQNPARPAEFVARHAQATDPEVCRRHINLYVNDFSVALGEKGELAVRTLFSKGKSAGFFTDIVEPVFVDKPAC